MSVQEQITDIQTRIENTDNIIEKMELTDQLQELQGTQTVRTCSLDDGECLSCGA